MKKKSTTTFCISIAAFIINSIVNAQTFSLLDVNNIKARVNSDATLFDNMTAGKCSFEVPKGSGLNTIFISDLWIGGKDEGNSLHLAAQTYRQNGTDFFQGPIMDSVKYS